MSDFLIRPFVSPVADYVVRKLLKFVFVRVRIGTAYSYLGTYINYF